MNRIERLGVMMIATSVLGAFLVAIYTVATQEMSMSGKIAWSCALLCILGLITSILGAFKENNR